jgi:hypothetical protein
VRVWGLGDRKRVWVGDEMTGREVREWGKGGQERSKSVGTRGQEEK